jgi:hypothetical protein
LNKLIEILGLFMAIGALSSSLLFSLKQGHSLVVDSSGDLRPITWGESFVRWINWGKARKQDQEVADWLIQHLNQSQTLPEYPKTVEAVAKFAKACQKSGEAFKRLENTVLAHKCVGQLPSLKIEDLIQNDGTATSELLPFLKRNCLHYVIAKANAEHKETALLIDGNQIYIRAKTGQNFLEKASDIHLILQRIPTSHTDTSLLIELRDLLEAAEAATPPGETDAVNLNDEKIEKIREKLQLSHYCYQPLEDVLTDNKGMLLSQAYLADGIEDFEHSQFDHLRPCFREDAKKPTYKLRIVTRLPAYALEKSTWRMLISIARNIFDFRAHGHSWVELTAPILDEEKNWIGKQDVYNVGYYFHPLDRYKRFESADPMAYMPIPSDQLVVEEVEITEQEFEKAQLYIEEMQKLLKNPNHSLTDKPKSRLLSAEEIKEVRYLYKSTLKSTCLSFANVLKELATGIETDNRSTLRRWLFPKKDFKEGDRLDSFIERTYLLRYLIALPRFLERMELPYWVKFHHKGPQKSEELEKIEICAIS